MIARVGERREGNRGGAPAGKEYHTQESQMRAWNGRAFAAVALIVGATCLASVVHYAGETNHRGFVSSAHAQPAADPQIDRLVARPDYACRDRQGGGTHRSDTGRCFVEICRRSRGRCGAGGRQGRRGSGDCKAVLAAARGAIASRAIRTPIRQGGAGAGRHQSGGGQGRADQVDD